MSQWTTREKCVTLEAVYEDEHGKCRVERWEGDAADRAMSEFCSGASCTAEQMCCSRKEIAEVEANIKPQTITHPLRRVTTLHGPYIGPDCECAACIKTSPGNYSGLEDLIPDGVPDQQFHGVDERTPWSWRIVVEAMPVERVKP